MNKAKEGVNVDKKAWIIFGAVVVILFGGLIWWSQSTKPKTDVSNIDQTKILAASDQNGQIADHVYGSTANKVTIIEYGDYQCIYCFSAFPQLQAVTKKYADNVTFIFRNFPLTTIHPNALAAATAAEAVGLQGKFWEMHDLLYTTHDEWENLTGDARTKAFASYASSLGINMDQYNKDLTSSKVTQKLAFDRALGNKIGVQSTPTLYVNGTQVSQDVISDLETSGGGDKLRALLNSDLKAANLPVPSTTSS
jgi:protein-disulfide isomerase